MLPRIVLFDLIGTLTYPWRQPSANERLEFLEELWNAGIRIGPKALDAALEFSLHYNCPQKRFSTTRQLLLDIIQLLGESASETVLKILDKELKNRLPTLRPYTKNVLDELRVYGIMSVMTTGLPSFLVTHFCDELTGYVDRWFTSTDIGFSKGHPDFLSQIFQILRVDEPAKVLVVGSDEFLDFVIPKTAGTQVMHIGDRELTPSLETIEKLPNYIQNRLRQ
ncbi:MAG: HAD family hydrolase [Candidatus Heimdallarchaeota archaeon]